MQKTIKKNLSLICLFLLMFCGQAYAQQQKEIKGTVKDSAGEPLIGVTVSVKGTTKAAITDLDGNYTISVPANTQSLQATYVGMKPSDQPIKGDVVNFTLQDNTSELDEVVVIGYGTVKRKDLTGAVSSVKGDAVQAVPVSNVAEAITGRLAGVQVTTTEGSPDAELKIRVRGGGSITQSNDPLYIVDGFPVSSISDIPSSDIESIDVLKDASSTAIYGSRGANGVILITTKSGKEGKIRVNYNAYYSWKKIAKKLDVLSPKDYASWQYELAALIKSSDMSSYTDYFGAYQDMDLYDNVPYNDWQDLTFGRTGHTFNHSLNINGGSDKISFAFGYAHMNDKAIMQGSSFKRDNFSLKLNAKPAKNVGLDFSVRYTDTDIFGGGANDTKSTYDTDKRLKYSVIYTPVPANLNSDSGSSSDDLGNLFHPLVSISDNDRMQERKVLNLAGSFSWDIFKNFRVKSEFGLDDYRNNDNRYWGTTTYYVKNEPLAGNQGKPAIQIENLTSKKFRNTNTINYDFKKFMGEGHSLNAMVGHEYIIEKVRDLTTIVHGFPESFGASEAWKLSTQGSAHSIENFFQPDDKLLSYFGRANYNLKDKYLLSATFRADGSSRFGDGNHWGYFPSAALAWRLSSESFMSGAENWLDDMKLRLSFGTAGNNNIPKGQMSQTYASKTTTWINGFGSYWGPSKTMANPDLKWETTVTRNIGLDFTMFRGKLNGSIDAYLNSTKDLLIEFPVAGTGYDFQYRNMGKTENRGIEATFNWVAIDKKNYGLSIGANIGFNKSEIKSLGIMNDFGVESRWASSEIGNDYWVAVGGSVGKMYGYRADGRYEVSDFEGYDEVKKVWKLKEGVVDASAVVGTIRPGAMKLKDVTDDGKVTPEDRQIIGDANPVNTGGINISGRVYGFDLTASFNWSVGNDIYNANKIEFTQTSKYQYRNMISDMGSGSRWTNLRPDGTISNDAAELTSMNANTTMWSPYTARMVFSDWAVEDGSFFRLNTLTLGYTLPSTMMSKIRVNTLRFYVTGYNLFCLTKYSGYDPEVSTMRKTNLTPGVDYSAYPRSRQFIIGMNLNF